ncbi:MAG: hypothetical protein JNL29_10590 [Nitrospira sp.]|nr:hypothetical protein [Nitrospira sp.]
MVVQRRFVILCLSAVAYVFDGVDVFAHGPQSAASSGTTEVRAVVEQDVAWDVVEWTERRYKIEAVGFKARNETGWDWWGSDEVMVGTEDSKGWTVSGELNGIDSGEFYSLDPVRSCVVAVRPGIVVLGKTSVCDEAGEPTPLSFAVELWEKDLFGWRTGFCKALPPGKDLHAGPHCADDGSGTDFIGRAQVDLSALDLEAVLPNVGDEHIETVVLSPCPGGEVCGDADLPDYSFTFRVTRVRDARVELRSLLDDAMHRTGARSELEAIVTGLRSLRAPSPRQVEPNLPK